MIAEIETRIQSSRRWLYGSGWLLIMLGIVHVAVWLAVGGPWEGAVSWRKPILFGISTGLTLLSFGWICSRIDQRPRDRFSIPLLSISLVAEVALITIQQWRGVASHFNLTTRTDATIEFWMTVLIALASAVIVDLSIRCFTGLHGSNDMQLAIRSGIAFLLLSIAIGFAISIYGHYRVTVGADPSTFGTGGVTKFPHGVAIHAIQLFPVCTLLLRKMGVTPTARIRFLSFATAAMAMFLLFSIWQTAAGFERFQPNAIGVMLLASTIAMAAKGSYEAFKT